MMYRAPDKRWRLCYDSFHRSKPFLGLTYHQLCIGPFIWEWSSGKLLNHTKCNGAAKLLTQQ